jgi:hypothetical protein
MGILLWLFIVVALAAAAGTFVVLAATGRGYSSRR